MRASRMISGVNGPNARLAVPPARRRTGLVAAGLALLLCLGSAAKAADAPPADASLHAQIAALARANGFRLVGGDRIAQAAPIEASGSLEDRIRMLLEGHNFAIVRGDSGGIAAVHVAGAKGPPPERTAKVSVKTVRLGANHFLDAVIMGRRPERRRVRLMVDTGASKVILPMSMMGPLGFRPGDVTEATLQTANGEITGKSGVLRSIEVGGAFQRDVAVAFVDDAGLGDTKLLGMSFLSRYILTIDDTANLITLERTRDHGRAADIESGQPNASGP